MSRGALGFVAGLAAGAVAGYAWWTSEQSEHQRALYSNRPLRRLAALGWLSGQPSAESVVMLREYVRWEQNPVLRRRARQLLARFEHDLAS